MASFQIQTFSGHSLDQPIKRKNLQTWNIKGWIFMTSIFKGTTKKKFLGASSPLNILQIPAVRILIKNIALIFAPSFLKKLTGEQVLEVTFEKVLICDIGSAVRPSEYKTLRYRE